MKKLTSLTTQRRFLSTPRLDRIYKMQCPQLGLLFSFLCFFLLVLTSNQVQAAPKPGDILVVDQVGGTDGLGALLLVKPRTGRRTVLSDFGNSAQGTLGAAIVSVAVGAEGQIYVSDLFAGGPSPGGALFEIDPDTGNRTLISNFGQGDIQGYFYYGLAVDSKGRLITNNAPDINNRLVRVDPETDERTVVTDFVNIDQGEIESDRFITDLTLERSGKILIGTATSQGDSAIYRVHPVTGKRRLLSDFANAAQGADVADLFFSQGLAVEASGQILVASGGSIFAPRILLLRINPRTGQRTVVSDFDNPAQGDVGGPLHGVAVENSGKIIVGTADLGNPENTTDATLLFRVNLKKGRRFLLSDSANVAQGRPFLGITSITVVPGKLERR